MFSFREVLNLLIPDPNGTLLYSAIFPPFMEYKVNVSEIGSLFVNSISRNSEIGWFNIAISERSGISATDTLEAGEIT